MFKKAWFRFLAWSTAVCFFFLTAISFACLLAPPPHQEHIAKWIGAMETVMENSIMGIAMHSSSQDLIFLQETSVKLIPAFGIIGLVCGFIVYLWGKVNEKG